MKISSVLFLLVSFSISQSAIAASIDERQDYQKDRIEQGIQSGELTKRESKRLIKQQHRIHKTEQRFKADGKFTKRERAIVQAKQTRASRNIYRQKHDRQTQN